jgi:dolichol-phosphate mannosyltransferase
MGFILSCFIGSIMVVSMGIMGYYVAKIFDEVKNRPKYIIGTKTNNE